MYDSQIKRLKKVKMNRFFKKLLHFGQSKCFIFKEKKKSKTIEKPVDSSTFSLHSVFLSS